MVAALAFGADAYFSAQEGYLARPPDYDGVGYMVYAQTPYLLLRDFHLRTAIDHLNNVAPLWTAVLSFHYLVLGEGTWQAFATRYLPIAMLLVLVYWIVRTRATRSLAIAAMGLTALLPLVSAGVRSSSWEFLSGQANYNDDWGLDDLRPDFFTMVLVVWSVALLAEYCQAPRRSNYLISAAVAAAAVLMKPSTSPVILIAWVAALAVTWFWNRRTKGAAYMTVLAAGLFTLLLVPWAVFGGGIDTTLAYLREVTGAYRDAYALNLGFAASLTYYLVRIPAQLGQVEAWPVILGSPFLAVALLRRRLERPEWIYAGLVLLFFIGFTLTSNKNPHVGEWFTLSLWIFFLTGASRFAAARWPEWLKRTAPKVLAAVSAYVLIVYALGAVALINWPANEQKANAQLMAVTADLARELGRHVSPSQCFTYAPGPGWPASLEFLLTTSNGATPQSTTIDVDPRVAIRDYVNQASTCPAAIVYREDISQVAQAFFCPPVRQPYLRALAQWVTNPLSGYALLRSWRLMDLPPVGPHSLGHYQGVSLTVDLYLRPQ